MNFSYQPCFYLYNLKLYEFGGTIHSKYPEIRRYLVLFNYREEMYFLNHTSTYDLFDAFIFCHTTCEDYCIVIRHEVSSKAVLQKGAQEWELLVMLDMLMWRIDSFSKRV